MSRSKKGKKAPGYDLWSRRPTKGTSPGRASKKRTIKMERKQNKKLTKDDSDVEWEE